MDESAAGSIDGILLINAGDGEIKWHNSAAAKLLGSAQLPKFIAELFTPDSVASITKTVEFNSVEVTLLGNGLVLNAVVVELPLSAPTPRPLLIVLKTFTPAQQALREREQFLGTVAHDLKNPISAVFGYVDTLLAVGRERPGREVETLRRIRSTALRALELVRNYQQLAAIRWMGVRPTSTTCDLNSIVRAVLEQSWRDDQGQQLVLNLHPGPLPVFAERIACERVISNLYTNAQKYTPPNGEIRITTELKGSSAILEICNAGPGISAEDLPMIFERYKRAAGSGGTSGAGLGLYIVKRIVEGLKGNIEVQSSQEKGTTFRVTIPCKAAQKIELGIGLAGGR